MRRLAVAFKRKKLRISKYVFRANYVRTIIFVYCSLRYLHELSFSLFSAVMVMKATPRRRTPKLSVVQLNVVEVQRSNGAVQTKLDDCRRGAGRDVKVPTANQTCLSRIVLQRERCRLPVHRKKLSERAASRRYRGSCKVLPL